MFVFSLCKLTHVTSVVYTWEMFLLTRSFSGSSVSWKVVNFFVLPVYPPKIWGPITWPVLWVPVSHYRENSISLCHSGPGLVSRLGKMMNMSPSQKVKMHGDVKLELLGAFCDNRDKCFMSSCMIATGSSWVYAYSRQVVHEFMSSCIIKTSGLNWSIRNDHKSLWNRHNIHATWQVPTKSILIFVTPESSLDVSFDKKVTVFKQVPLQTNKILWF